MGATRHALGNVGIDRLAVAIVCDLESAPIDIRKPVIVATEIQPDRQCGRCESAFAGGDAEVEHFLSRREDASAEHVGQHAAKPWPAREDEAPGADRFARSGGDFRKPSSAWLLRYACLVDAQLGATSQAIRDHGLHRATRQQPAAPRLEDRPASGWNHDLRITARECVGIEYLVGDAERIERRHRPLGRGVVRMRHPQHAGFAKQFRPFDPCEEILPQDQRSLRHPRVDRVRSVRHADHPRFAAGARARVRRPVLVDQQHPLPGALQVPCSPRAEDAGSDHCNVVRFAHPGNRV